ncbi:sulfurtransferase [Streptomyces sp. TRM43335]|uniref:Sulfurtransferase n=1 Tax=Streptomyces taklimakanensis TaxID=2569853 RepID=A0A6G2BGF5_9ACTN|nr:sulfurtransferase [Streptomyces taklimakanensis]MTE21367.1 sulfurtransferase [Streptomyces taklimakanensis]
MAVIVTPTQLARELTGPSVPPTLLDVRWRQGGPLGRAEYETGHLPGAVYVDLDTELAGPVGEGTGRHPLPDPDEFGAAMRRAGVRDGHPVVVYDGGQGWGAARAWWLLRWAGHEDVRVLDGGLAAWDGPLSRRTPEPVEGDFTPRPGALPVLDADGAAALARTGVLLDARAAERYRGEVEPIDRVAGHIPGALSAPTTRNTTADGTSFRPAAELAARFAGLGVDADTEVGVYCGSGVSGAHEVLALAIASIDAALYVGSWSQWSADPSRPVATGPEPG